MIFSLTIILESEAKRFECPIRYDKTLEIARLSNVIVMPLFLGCLYSSGVPKKNESEGEKKDENETKMIIYLHRSLKS